MGEARAVLARVEAAERALAEVDSLNRGTLQVQASKTIATYWLPQRLAKFRQVYPQIRIQLAIDNTANVTRAVLDGLAEVGFVEGAVNELLLRICCNSNGCCANTVLARARYSKPRSTISA